MQASETRARAWRRPLVLLGWLRLPAGRDARIAVAGVAVLLLAGGGLRLFAMTAWRPAFMGYPDEISYIRMAMDYLWGDPLRVGGYPLFLRTWHDVVTQNLSITILVQHLMGLASGLLVFGVVRRVGGPAWLGLLAMAAVVLNGAGIFLEHSVLSEAPYILLQSAILYVAIRALGSERAVPTALLGLSAGVLLGAAITVRVVAVPLVPVIALGLALGLRGPWLRRLAPAVAVVAGTAAVMVPYVVIQHSKNGFTGLAPAGAWNLYGRVAPFADCSKFTPPNGTRVLCQTIPPSQRPNVEAYTFSADVSPAVKAFGNPFASSRESNRKIAAFARAVILHQPLDYLSAVATGMAAYILPDAELTEAGNSYELFFRHVLFDPNIQEQAHQFVLRPYYGVNGFYVNASRMNVLYGYERATRVEGGLMALLWALSLLAPFVVRAGPVRRATALLTVVAWVLLIVPVATHWWDSRTTVPVLGPLTAAAALGGWGAVLRGRALIARARA